MGHIVKTPAGTFRANWRDPAGRQKAKTFPTRKEAAAYLADISSSVNRGTYVDPKVGRLKFAAHAERWLASRHVEARTHERTLSVMRNHVLPQWSKWPLGQIGHTAVQDWVNSLSIRLSPASVSKCFGTLSMILDAAIRARLIAFNPCTGVSLPSAQKPQRQSVAMSRADFFTRLLPAVPAAHRPIVAMAGGCGLRWGECAGITWSAIDLDNAVLRVVQVVVESSGHRSVKPYPKSRAGVRSVPMPGFLVAELAARRAALGGVPRPDALVFTSRTGSPLVRSTFRRDVWRPSLVRAGLLGAVVATGPQRFEARWSDSAGVARSGEFATEQAATACVAQKAAGGLRFHDLRHSYATWLVSDGVPVNIVRAVMGHESTSTTLNLYTHAPGGYDDRVREVFEL